MDDIADMISHILQYFIQQQHDQNFRHYFKHYCFYTSADIYLSVQKNSQHSMLDYFDYSTILIDN